LFSFIHCADLHLDSPFEGLHAVEPKIARILKDATFKSFDNIIDLAIREHADFLIVAGDVYDGADRSLRAQIKFRDALTRATDAGVQCFVAHGNHDPLSGWEAKLSLPKGVHRFGGEAVEEAVVRRGGAPLAHVYGISYPVREVKENLTPGFKAAHDSAFGIGVLHCNLGGNPNHDNYAPCTVEDLLTCKLNYWALGHVHTRQVARAQDPLIAYPGNPQGRSVRELGARGCYLVRVSEDGVVVPDFVATDVVRWFSEQIEVSDLNTLDELLEALGRAKEEVRMAAEGRGAILRLQLSGRGELHGVLRRPDQVQDLAALLREGETERADFVWVESLSNRTRPPLDLAQRRLMQDFIGDFLNAAEEIRSAENPGSALHRVLSKRPEQRVITEDLDVLSDTGWLEILNDSEILGLDLLLPEEGT